MLFSASVCLDKASKLAARNLKAPVQIQRRLYIQDSVTQKRRQAWIQSSDNPLSVPTSEEIDARVMDFEEIEGSENSTCIGNKIGKVVRVWASVNQTEDGIRLIKLELVDNTYRSLVGSVYILWHLNHVVR
jgi:hypothetical protein